MNINQITYKIHVFGDSHSRLYSSPYLSNYICNVYYVGPLTMHRVGRDKITLVELQKISKEYYIDYLKVAKPEYKHMNYPIDDKIEEKDLVVFVFGEIDIRAHFVRQIEKGRNENEILNKLSKEYISTVLMNKNNYPNVTFCIQSIISPTNEINIEDSLKDFPVYGDINKRIKATQTINKMLKQMCKENNILFLDTQTYYQNDETFFPIPGLSDKSIIYELDSRIKDKSVHVHINNPEGINHVLTELNIPTNLNYSEYGNKKCKYKGNLNYFQRSMLIRWVYVHILIASLMILLLFLPNKYFIVTIFYWLLIISINFIVSNGKCSFADLEFHISGCNDYGLFDMLRIPRKFQKIVWLIIYIIALIIIIVRGYYYFYKKNLFSINYRLKWLK